MSSKSYKVVASDDGQHVMSIIVPSNWTLKELNDLFRNGMKVTVVDVRSDLVNKKHVDKTA